MKRRVRRIESGQSLVEFAISSLVLVLLMTGLLDFGRLYFTYIALEDSAGEAALYLSLYPNCLAPDTGTCDAPNNAIYRASRATGGNLSFDIASGVMDATPPTDSYLEIEVWESDTTQVMVKRPKYYGAGDTVYVEMTYQFNIITPLIAQLVGDGTLPLTSTATQTIVSE